MTLTWSQPAIVIDASIAVPALKAESGWDAKLAEWIETGAMLLAPAHFGHEVANALLRSAGLRPDEAELVLERLFAIGIEPTDRGRAGLAGSMQLARRHGLTVYDAAYLDLALDVDGSLATRDRELAAAAEAEGVEVIS